MHCLNQHRITAGVVESLVKGVVEREDFRQMSLLARSLMLLLYRGQSGNEAGRGRCRDAFGGPHFEHFAQFVKVFHFARGIASDEDTTIGFANGQAGALKLVQGPAGGMPGRVEAFHELVFDEMLARVNPAGYDVVFQLVSDELPGA